MSRKYRLEWEKDPLLSLWLCESHLTPDKAYCILCEKDLSYKKDILSRHARENSIHKVRVSRYLRNDNREIEIENSAELFTIKESSASEPSPEVRQKECQENECKSVLSTKVVENKCYNALSTEVTERKSRI